MSLDPRILERFQEEFNASKLREADAQARVAALTTDLAAFQARVDDEAGIQQAINDALTTLGQPTFS